MGTFNLANLPDGTVRSRAWIIRLTNQILEILFIYNHNFLFMVNSLEAPLLECVACGCPDIVMVSAGTYTEVPPHRGPY